MIRHEETLVEAFEEYKKRDIENKKLLLKSIGESGVLRKKAAHKIFQAEERGLLEHIVESGVKSMSGRFFIDLCLSGEEETALAYLVPDYFPFATETADSLRMLRFALEKTVDGTWNGTPAAAAFFHAAFSKHLEDGRSLIFDNERESFDEIDKNLPDSFTEFFDILVRAAGDEVPMSRLLNSIDIFEERNESWRCDMNTGDLGSDMETFLIPLFENSGEYKECIPTNIAVALSLVSPCPDVFPGQLASDFDEDRIPELIEGISSFFLGEMERAKVSDIPRLVESRTKRFRAMFEEALPETVEDFEQRCAALLAARFGIDSECGGGEPVL